MTREDWATVRGQLLMAFGNVEHAVALPQCNRTRDESSPTQEHGETFQGRGVDAPRPQGSTANT